MAIIIPIIAGPTASGKSAFAISKAQNSNGIIINCDAMQCYAPLPILTAQPDADERAQIPHTLYGFLPANAHYSAADWRNDAIQTIQQAIDNGQTPIICGGTGFYIKALTEGLSPIPEIPNATRQNAMALQSAMGNPAFHQALCLLDAKTANKIDPMNTQRLVRAWEVFDHTGIGLADWQEKPLIGAPKDWQFHITALLPPREKLYEKINARVHKMLDLGCLDEIKTLAHEIENGLVAETDLIVKAHGFRAFRHYLNGNWSIDEAINYTQTETRQYAKRQMTWLRHQMHIDDLVETV